MITEEFKQKLKKAINKGGWGEENLKDALPIIEYHINQLKLYGVMQATPENAKCEIPNWDKSGRCFKCGKLVENHD